MNKRRCHVGYLYLLEILIPPECWLVDPFLVLGERLYKNQIFCIQIFCKILPLEKISHAHVWYYNSSLFNLIWVPSRIIPRFLYSWSYKQYFYWIKLNWWKCEDRHTKMTKIRFPKYLLKHVDFLLARNVSKGLFIC